MPRVFHGVDELAREAGCSLGATGWMALTHREVVAFAEATGDRQWIHVDPVRAATGPFGAPVVHGYYLFSLLPALLGELFTVNGVGAVVNTGVDRLRFHRPVRVGARFRASARLAEVEVRRRGVAELVLEVELHGDHENGPALTALLRQMVRPPMVRPAQPTATGG